MNVIRFLSVVLLLPLTAWATERSLKVDPSRSFVDVDVQSTLDSFTARLEAYDARLKVDETGKVKGGVFAFKFADLKTGKPERDAHMIEWLGGGAPAGQFEIGNLAITPNGQGHVSGRLTFHGVTERIEFPIEVAKTGDTYTVTGETTLDYRTWNLKVYRKAFVVKVDPEVKIRFKLIGEPVNDPVKK